MPIRNPFARRVGPVVTQDENRRPGSSAGPRGRADAAHPGFERVDTIGSKASSAFSIRSRKSQDTGEYKMSVVNDSGVYLPPSPIEKEASWPRRYPSRTSSSGASGEIEHFPLSRESFDSYRRSFDICARSPVVMTDHHPLPLPGRASLDAHRQQRRRLAARFPRPALFDAALLGGDPPRQRFAERDEPPTPEDDDDHDDDDAAFEDVGLNDDGTPQQRQGSSAQPASRRRGFFAKFGGGGSGGGGGSDGAAAPVEEVGTTMSRFLPGRKRTQSGQGAELAAMASGLDRPAGLQAQEVES